MNLPAFYKEILYNRLKLIVKKLRNACKTCNGQGFLDIEENGKIYYSECPNCVGIFNARRKYLDSNIPMEYLDISISELRNVFEEKVFDNYVKLTDSISEIIQKNYNLIFCKSLKTNSWGITTAGILMLKNLIDMKYECFMCDFISLLDYFFNFDLTDKENNKNKNLMLDFLKTVDVLLIDGIETEARIKNKEMFAYNKLCNFFEIRKHGNRMTIICTALTNQGLLDCLAGPIASILRTSYLPFEISCKKDSLKDLATTRLEKDNKELAKIFKIRTPVVLKNKETTEYQINLDELNEHKN